jgi:single-strand DNA-binding protein
MPGNYNRIILAGNLTRDPEAKVTQTGEQLVKFAIAVNRKTKSGEETMFVDITAWGKLAETCNTYLRKGSSVLVEGRLTIRSYDDKDGNPRKATEVVIDAMQMLDRKGDSMGNRGGYSASSNAGSSYGDESIESEIPF